MLGLSSRDGILIEEKRPGLFLESDMHNREKLSRAVLTNKIIT